MARLQRLYSVGAFPTIVVVRPGGKPDAMVGYPGKSGFEVFLRKVR